MVVVDLSKVRPGQKAKPRRRRPKPGTGTTERPPYRVPSMAEIAAAPKNGLVVVSTFTGCGGGCSGFEMDGYRVAWANEFVPAAQDSYRPNHPGTFLNTDDVRTVEPGRVLEEAGLEPGAIDVLEGSPPCASFSMSGKRHRHWGEERRYSDTTQRTDDLFFEYVRLLAGLRPKTFVAENVAGLVVGSAKGYFKEILRAMKAAGPEGYRVEARLLDASWLGVPQVRRRLIFVGVRGDLCERHGVGPVHPRPLPYRYTWADAMAAPLPATDDPPPPEVLGEKARRLIDWSRRRGRTYLKDAHLALYGRESWMNHHTAVPHLPVETIPAQSTCAYPAEGYRSLSVPELKRVCAFPDDFELTGTFVQRWERMGRSVPPVMMRAVAREVREKVLQRIPETEEV